MRMLDNDAANVLRLIHGRIGPGLANFQIQARELRHLLKELAGRLLSLLAEQHALLPLDIPATIR
ncbi:hypothetical protein [Sorangium sp. So ce204]|uniref:hypothetical protein n=1 Tax=Sorangium sp. So ce204 TaxID=3133288 RepID=UPI003F5E2537